MSNDRATAAIVASMTETEQAALPSRLRALVADERTQAWNAAKARRDAAIAAAWARVDPEDPESAYVIEDPDERAAGLDAARVEWTEFKAAALAEG